MVQENPDIGLRQRHDARGTEELLRDRDASTDPAVNVFQPGDTAGA
jgi:hypothetical protein